MEQTLATRFSDVPNHPIDAHDVLFVDEAHSMNYQTFIQKWLDAGTAVIGLSATPDDWRMLKFWDQEKILGPSQAELETLGVLVEPTFYTSAEIDLKADYADAGGASKKRLQFGNALTYAPVEMRRVENEIGRPLRWFVKTQKKEQAKKMAARLTAWGFPAKPFYSGGGGGTVDEMNAIMDGKSEHRVAVVVQRFAVGFDHAGIEGLVLTGSMLYSLFVQTVGRSLRPGWPRQKDTAFIVDLAGNLVQYKKRYLRRRTDPVKKLPDPPEERQSGPPPPKNIREFEEEKILLHKVVLSHLAHDSTEMRDSLLIAYCSTKAAAEIGEGDKFATARAKKINNNYWMLTGRNVNRQQIRNALIGDKEAMLVWRHRAPMPAILSMELDAKNMEYAREKRREYAMRNWG